MAVPSKARMLRGAPLKTGIILGISPSSDPTFDVELVRATSSGVYSTVARLTNLSGGVRATYEDLLPLSTNRFSYKARSVKQGYAAGDYTAILTARPTVLPEILPNVTPLTGRAIGAPVYISTGGGGVPFGQPASAKTYTKKLRIAAADFMPTNEALQYALNNGELATNTTGTATASFTAPVSLPFGAQVISFGFLAYRGSTKAGVTISLDSHTTSGVVAGTAKSASGTSYTLASSTAFGLSASSVRSIHATLSMINGAAPVLNARIVWLDLNYTVPSLQAAI